MQGGSNQKKREPLAKLCVQRHGHASKRSYNAADKAAETKVRRQGRRSADIRLAPGTALYERARRMWED